MKTILNRKFGVNNFASSRIVFKNNSGLHRISDLAEASSEQPESPQPQHTQLANIINETTHLIQENTPAINPAEFYRRNKFVFSDISIPNDITDVRDANKLLEKLFNEGHMPVLAILETPMNRQSILKNQRIDKVGQVFEGSIGIKNSKLDADPKNGQNFLFAVLVSKEAMSAFLRPDMRQQIFQGKVSLVKDLPIKDQVIIIDAEGKMIFPYEFEEAPQKKDLPIQTPKEQVKTEATVSGQQVVTRFPALNMDGGVHSKYSAPLPIELKSIEEKYENLKMDLKSDMMLLFNRNENLLNQADLEVRKTIYIALNALAAYEFIDQETSLRLSSVLGKMDTKLDTKDFNVYKTLKFGNSDFNTFREVSDQIAVEIKESSNSEVSEFLNTFEGLISYYSQSLIPIQGDIEEIKTAITQDEKNISAILNKGKRNRTD